MKTIATHTPGPWHKKGATIGADGLTIAAIYGNLREPETQANARLIAAAPDLLAACRKAVQYIDDGCSEHPIMTRKKMN